MKKIFIIILAVAGLLLASCDNSEKTGTLSIPEGVTAELSGTTISVQWNEVAGADFYIVYYKTGSQTGFSKSDPLTSTRYYIDDVAEGVTYEIKVRASSNSAVSKFCELVSVAVPEPEKPAVPKADAVAVSNVRAGLGWINFTIATISDPCEYACYDGETKLAAEPELISSDETAGTAEYSLSGLELSKTYTDLNIKRAMDGYNDSDPSSFGSVTTGAITVLTRNVSPCHLAFEWDDVAGNANWTFDAAIDPLTRTYKVELAKDPEFTSIVYSLFTVNNFNAAAGAFANNNWIGESGTPTEPVKPYANANTAITFGQLEPSTTYYLRIRNAAGETVPNYIKNDGSTIEMNATTGKSAWSAVVSATTGAAHTASANELLYQGFDDHAIQSDPFNCTCGVAPVGNGITYSYPWNGEWGVMLPHTSKRYDEMGASATGSFPGNGETKLDGLAVYRMETDVIPSMKGWFCAKACYPLQGALKIGSSAGQKNYIITPAFTGLSADTQVTISCDAGAYHASSTQARLNIKIYRAATHALEQILTKDLPAGGYILSPLNNGYHNIAVMSNCSADATLKPGDYVMFESETVADPVMNRLVLDNILIVKK